jgi:lipopolysaccharide/colanic/teichoic acid biosynthesis glycosyltransferase
MFYQAIKRLIDITGASVGLLFFSPVILWAAVKIKREMSPPAIFAQDRAGRGGLRFRLYKFRTMTNERGETGELLPDERRLTPLGKWLRSTSLDELPQLWNVVKGDMSLVGPRPLLLDYVPLYSDTERRRLDVPPGITGWAQINGRNTISWQEKFELDIWYVENKCLALDVKIILLTIMKALRREGISAEGEATMPRFLGTRGGDGSDDE